MRTRYTYLGESTIEIVVDGESIDVNVLPSPDKEEDYEVVAVSPAPAPVLATQLLAAEQVVVPTVTKKKRTLMGFIRATWFIAFTMAGEALTYGLNNLTTLNLPPGTATAIGAVGYGLKKAVFPDTIV